MSIFHRHKWKIVGYQPNGPYWTDISMYCESCGKPEIKEVFGHWKDQTGEAIS